MKLQRFYCDNITEPITTLDTSQAHHLNNVRRLKPGDKVEIFDGKGRLASCSISEISKKKVSLKIDELQTFEKSNTPQIIIAASIAKGDRFDWLISKATELGVDRITPVIFERTVRLPGNPKIMNRWHNLTVSSAKQCRRLFLPTIDEPVLLEQAVSLLKSDYPNARLLTGSLDDAAESLICTPFDNSDCIAVIGPEGGITDAESAFLQKENALPVRLTDTILRVETAALALAAILTTQRDSYAKK